MAIAMVSRIEISASTPDLACDALDAECAFILIEQKVRRPVAQGGWGSEGRSHDGIGTPYRVHMSLT